ncbi:MAG: ketopantoate reductase family protein [Clostridia bacterium]|nr:ketopantoate reductase family protein [Clostridia bacterium]
MKIAVLGAGAMGALYGGYLSRGNDVLLVDVRQEQVDQINAQGLKIHEPDGTTTLCHPAAAIDTSAMGPVDLVIVFVKAMFSRAAIAGNRSLIGPDTYLMTLQNGSGHEDTLMEFVDREHVIIGTTQHNCAVVGTGEVRHGGSGKTCIGCLTGDVSRLQPIADAFTACGLDAVCDGEVLRLIWGKMMTNVSASVLTGALQVPLGYIAENASAWALCERLVREAVAVAGGEGLLFDAKEEIAKVRAVCERSPQGITSICADIAAGRKTEVDTISGSVVRASRRNGIPAPTHEAMVHMIHAMEGRAAK